MEREDFEKVSIPIVEIFNSISGEGISAGYVATFLRAAGCNLRCSYCDTVYSYCEVGESVEMLTPSEILEKVGAFSCREIICTGGEPLEMDKAKRYVPIYLASNGYNVRIETNGSQPLYSDEEVNEYGLVDHSRIKYSLDVKCPGSKMSMDNIEDTLLKNNFMKLKKGDELKFVVGSEEDLSYSLRVIEKYKNIFANNKVITNFTPVFGKLNAERIVEFLRENNKYFEGNALSVRLSLQIHKYIWEPNQRGV